MRVENDILIPELARLLNEGKEVRFTPSGVSMRPFIEGDRDSVILAPLTRAPRVGDILLAKAQTEPQRTFYVLHRLVRIEKISDAETRLVLQGDGNLSGEEYSSPADVIGLVKRVESPSGRRKPLTRGRIWRALRPIRGFLLKIYRHTILKCFCK